MKLAVHCMVALPWWVKAVAFCTVLWTTGCASHDCLGIGVGGVSVTVVGAAVEECLASVSIVDGKYHEDLGCFPRDGDCLCAGAFERPGTYTVTVTFDGLEKSKTVTARRGECHVYGEPVEFDFPSPTQLVDDVAACDMTMFHGVLYYSSGTAIRSLDVRQPVGARPRVTFKHPDASIKGLAVMDDELIASVAPFDEETCVTPARIVTIDPSTQRIHSVIAADGKCHGRLDEYGTIAAISYVVYATGGGELRVEGLLVPPSATLVPPRELEDAIASDGERVYFKFRYDGSLHLASASPGIDGYEVLAKFEEPTTPAYEPFSHEICGLGRPALGKEEVFIVNGRSIVGVPKEGGNAKVVREGLVEPLAVATDGKHLCIAEGDVDPSGTTAILCGTTRGENLDEVAVYEGTVVDLRVFDGLLCVSTRRPDSGRLECQWL